MNPKRFVEMTWPEVEELDQAKTLLFLPLSPVEVHGPHLPIGTDLLAAEDVAVAAAARILDADPSLTVVLAPSIPLGCAAATADFPGTLSVKGRTLLTVVRDVLTALAESGFRHIVICNHHLDPVHMKAILSAVNQVVEHSRVAVVETASRIHYAGGLTETVREGRRMGIDMTKELHADVKETAYVQYRHPGWIKGDVSRLPPVLVDVRSEAKAGRRTFKSMGADMGYIGSPSLATPDVGRLYLEETASLAADLGLKLVRREALPPMNPRILAFLEKHVELD